MCVALPSAKLLQEEMGPIRHVRGRQRRAGVLFSITVDTDKRGKETVQIVSRCVCPSPQPAENSPPTRRRDVGGCPQQQLKTQDKHPFLISHQKGVELLTIFKNSKTRVDRFSWGVGGLGISPPAARQNGQTVLSVTFDGSSLQAPTGGKTGFWPG